MTNASRKSVKSNMRRRMNRSVLILRHCIRCFYDQFFTCSRGGKHVQYRMLPRATPAVVPSISRTSSFDSAPSCFRPPPTSETIASRLSHDCLRVDSDRNNLVALKISLLGDCHIGKTSFLEKYVGTEKEPGKMEVKDGLNLADKTFQVGEARLTHSVWEIPGDKKAQVHLPKACQDSIAICVMFDLTSRRTLNSVVRWFQQALRYNQTAIPILIGTKFDEFIQLPLDLQWTIASQARAYAKAFNATLFFSSATYNINVNKIFKFITAKLFDLPWNLERNLNIGEPIIDF